MKRLVVLALAFGIMIALRALTAQTEASLVLAAVGFVVLASFTVGELGARLGLPKVTGYIVAGVVLGPQVANILSTTVVAEMRVFNTLALGLIATSAGLELDLKAIKRVWKVLTAVVLLKVPLLILLVGGAFVGVETLLGSLDLPAEAILPVALVIAVLGIGTSPAIALAVVNDGHAKGRLTELLLAIAVVKDLVVVVSLAVALALAKAMLDPSAHLDAHVLVHVAEELGSSIAVGAVLGGVLIAYIRFVRKQMLLMAVLMILVIAELSATLHLELLLVFIMAGFMVRNLSPYEHDLLDPIERIALPVFVVFFTTAGAGVDLVGTLKLLPLALTLVIARVAAFYLAGRVGSAVAGEGPKIADNAWLTWLPQAGVTLGLVFLAAKALPELSVPLTAIGMALVAINLLVGPVTLGIGLSRAGEMGAGLASHGHDEHASDGSRAASVVDGDAGTEATEELPVEPTAEMEAPAVRTIDDVLLPVPPEVAAPVRELVLALDDEATAVIEAAAPLLRAQGAIAADRAERAGSIEDRLGRVAERPDPGEDPWLERMLGFTHACLARVQGLPVEVRVDVQADAPPAHQDREGASALARLTGRLQRLGLGSRRTAPLRMLARVAFEPRFAEACREVAASRVVLLARMHEKLGANLLDGQPAPDVDHMVHRWTLATKQHLHTAVLEASDDLAASLLEYTSPLGRPSAPRYSTVEATVRTAVDGLSEDDPRCAQAVTASVDQLRLTTIVAALADRMSALHAEWGQAAIADIEASVLEAIDVAIEHVEQIRAEAVTVSQDEDWSARMKTAFPLKSRISVRMAAQTFRQRVQPNQLTNHLVGLFDVVPETLQRSWTAVSRATNVRDLHFESFPARRRLRTLVLDERVPELCRKMDELVPELEAAHVHIAEGVEVAAYGLSVAQRDATDGSRGAVESLQRSAEWLRDYRASVVTSIEACRAGLEAEHAHTLLDLRAVQVPKSGVSRVQSNVAEVSTLLRARLGNTLPTLARGVGVATAWLQRSLDDPRLVERSVRAGVVRLDAQAMRAALEPMRAAQLPGAVDSMFSMRPVDDRRQFIARRPVFERLQAHLAQPDPAAPMLALISGPRSSGRTSLVNVLQLSARKLRVVRPEEAYHDRATGLIAALSTELQCEDSALESILTRDRTLVVLDNLERFFLPTHEGLQDLERLLSLAAATATQGTQWVMTIEADALARLQELVPVVGLFNQHERLAPVGWEELERTIRGRARLGGFDVDAARVGTRMQRLQWTPSDLWFQELAEVCAGNLGGAIAAWRSLVQSAGDRTFRVTEVGRRTIPFVSQLSLRGRAIAAALHTWGPMDIPELAVVTGIPIAAIGGHLHVLCTTGLVRSGPSVFEVDPTLLQPLHQELITLKLCLGDAR